MSGKYLIEVICARINLCVDTGVSSFLITVEPSTADIFYAIFTISRRSRRIMRFSSREI